MQEPTENSSSQPNADISTSNQTVSTDATESNENTATPSTEKAVVSETEITSEPEAQTTSANTAVVSVRRQILKQYGIAALIVVLMGIVLWYLLEEQGRVKTGIFDDIKGLVVAEPAAVKVNGEKIPLSIYEKNYSQLVEQASAQGANIDDQTVSSQLKQQAIDILVNSALLKQAAVEAGVVVTKEQVDARYQSIVESQGGAEALEAKMAELNITKDSLINDINDEILIQTHLTKAVDTSKISVTDEEIKTLYDSVAGNKEIKVPPLEEVKDQIEQEIRFGKEQELISEYIDTLKKDASIEVLI